MAETKSYVTPLPGLTSPGGILNAHPQPPAQSWIDALRSDTLRQTMVTHPSDTVYFQPEMEFTASRDGFTAERFSPGIDTNGDPELYLVARYKGEVWQGLGWGKIVDIRTVIKGNTNLPEIPPTRPDQRAEVVAGMPMADPALKVAKAQAPTATTVAPAKPDAPTSAKPDAPAEEPKPKLSSAAQARAEQVEKTRNAAKGAKA